MTKQELYEKAMMLPSLPGVYIIRDREDVIIYIGKAKRLKTRVSQYFRPGVPHEEKVEKMIGAARNFDVIVTASEFEALVLECGQIKKHKPRYNILLKDDKGYSYVKISNEPWPRISAEYRRENDGAVYLGPYLSNFAVTRMLQAAEDSFLLPRCNRKFPEDFGKQRPCLYMHIGKCMGVCTGKIKQKDYLEAVENALDMIKRGRQEIISQLRQRMEAASENLDFERAALLRDQIKAVERAESKQTIVQSSNTDQDVIAFAKSSKAVCAAILRFREGMLADKREFMFYNSAGLDELREEFLPQYYLDDEEEVPKVIAVDAPLPDQDLLARLLAEKRGGKVQIYTPERGDNAKLVQTAYVNAMERLARESGRTSRQDKQLEELAGLLGLESPPRQIESYDISNWGDGTSVCGMVVFEDGKPQKSGYRRFKIKTVTGTDDYASMAETLMRRAAEYDAGSEGRFGIKPDLILLDGGRGQVTAVAAVLAGTGLADVPLYGMVKDNKHRTRGIINAAGQEVVLSMHRGVFTFVTEIQDEVHRFANDYRKRLNKKASFSSVLTSISGVGPATAKALMSHFKTIKAIAAASQEELGNVKGISSRAAKAVFEYYHESP